MPIARFQMPDGRIARFEVPEGTSPEEAQALMEQAVASGAAAGKPAQPKSGFMNELSRGLKSFLGSSGTGIAALGGQDAANRAAVEGLQRSKQIAAEHGEDPWSEVKRVYNDPKGGFFPAAGKFVANMPSAMAGQVPQLGVALGAAKLGAMAGAPLGPVGSAVGAGVTTLGAMYPQFLGSNIQTQAEEAQKNRQPVSVDLPAAHLAAAGSSALEVGGGALALGRKAVTSILGIPAKTVAEQSAKAAAKLAVEAQRTLAGTVARGAGRGLAVEMPVELAQAVMERAQAGQSLVDDEAMAAYGDVLGSTAMVAPGLGVAGNISARRSAQREFAQQEEQRQIQAEQAAEQRAEQEKAAQAERVKDPAYAAEVADRYRKAEATYRSMLPPKLPKGADEATKAEHAVQMKAAKEFLETELKPLIPEYLAVKPTLQAAQAAQQPAAPAPNAGPTVEEEAGLLFKPEPLADGTNMSLPLEGKGQIPVPENYGGAPTADMIAAVRVRLAEQQQALDVHLETLRDQAAKAAQAGDTQTAIRLSNQFKQAEQARDAAAQQIAALPKAPKNVDLAKQLEKAKKALALAGENGDPDAILRAAAKVEKLKSQGAELMQPGPEMEMVPAGGKSESQEEFFPKVATDTLSPKPLQLPFDASKIAVPDRGQGPARLSYDSGTDIRAMEANRMDTSQTAQPDLFNPPEMKTQVKQGVGDVSTKSRAQLLADLQIARAAMNASPGRRGGRETAAVREAIEGLRDLKAREEAERAKPSPDVSNIAGSQLAATMGSRLPGNVAKQQAARDAVYRAYGNFVSILNRFNKGLAKREERDLARKQVLDNLIDDIGITRGLPLTAPEADAVRKDAARRLTELQDRFGDTRDVINQGTEKEPDLVPVQERDGTFIRDRIERPQGTANVESRGTQPKTFDRPYASAQALLEEIEQIRNNAINDTPGVPGVVGKQTKTVTSPEDLDEAIAKAKPSPLLERLKDNLPAFASDPARRNLAAEWLYKESIGQTNDTGAAVTAELDRLEGGKRSETEGGKTAVQSEMFDGKGALFDTFEEFDAYLAGDAVKEMRSAAGPVMDTMSRIRQRAAPLERRVAELKANIANLQKQRAGVQAKGTEQAAAAEKRIAAAQAKLDSLLSAVETKLEPLRAEAREAQQALQDAYQTIADIEARIAANHDKFYAQYDNSAYIKGAMDTLARAREKHIALINEPNAVENIQQGIFLRPDVIAAGERVNEALIDAIRATQKEPSSRAVQAFLNRDLALHLELQEAQALAADAQKEVRRADNFVEMGSKVFEANIRKSPEGAAAQRALRTAKTTAENARNKREGKLKALAEDINRLGDELDASTKALAADLKPALKRADGRNARVEEDLEAKANAERKAENDRLERLADIPGEQVTFTDLAAAADKFAELPEKVARLERKAADETLPKTTRAKAKNDAKKYRTRMETLHGLLSDDPETVNAARDAAQKQLDDVKARIEAKKQAVNADGITDKVRLSRTAELYDLRSELRDLQKFVDGFGKKVKRTPRGGQEEKDFQRLLRGNEAEVAGELSDSTEESIAAYEAFANDKTNSPVARRAAQMQATLMRTNRLAKSKQGPLMKKETVAGNIRTGDLGTTEQRKLSPRNPIVQGGQTRSPTSTQAQRAAAADTAYERAMIRLGELEDVQTRAENALEVAKEAVVDAETPEVKAKATARVKYLERGLEGLKVKIDAQQKIVDDTVTGRKRKAADLGTKFDDVADKPKEAAALAAAKPTYAEPGVALQSALARERRAVSMVMTPQGGTTPKKAPAPVATPEPQQAKPGSQTQSDAGSKAKPAVFRTATNTGAGMKAAEVTRLADRIVEGWTNVPQITVVDNEAALPQRLQDQAAADGMTGKVPGLFDPDTGTVYLVAENLHTGNDVALTIAHEVAGHYGLRDMMGPDYASTMNRLYNGNSAIRKEADAKMKASPDLSKEIAVEETLADMAEKGDPSALRQIYQAIKAWLAKVLGLRGVSDKEVQQIVANARRHVQEGTARGTGAGGQAVYRTAKASPYAVASMFAKPRSFKDRIGGNLALAAEMHTVDMRAPVREALATGNKRLAEQAMYYIRKNDARMPQVYAVMQHGALGIKQDARGRYVVEAGHSKSVQDVFKAIAALPGKDAAAKMEAAQAYLTAKRALANPKAAFALDLGKEGMTPEVLANDLRKLTADPKQKEALENVARVYADLNRGLIKFLQETGAISKDEAASYTADDSYVPYYRVRGDGVAELVFDETKTLRLGDIRTQPYLKALEGGDAKLLPLNEAITRNVMLLTDMGMRNLTTRNVAYALQDIGKAAKKMQIRPNDGDANVKALRFKQDGKPYHIIVDTEGTPAEGIPGDMVARSLEGTHTVIPSFLKAFGWAGDLLRAGVTRNPMYVARQLFRDPFAASFTGGLDRGPLTAVAKAMAAFVRQTAGRKDATAEALVRKGVVQSGIFSGDPDDLSKMSLQLVGGDAGAFNKLFSAMDRAAMRADSVTRQQLYDDVLKRTGSEFDAEMAAMEMMNFHKRGLSPTVQYASRMIPFFNAQIQGLNVLHKAMTGKATMQERLGVQQKFWDRAGMLMAGTLIYAMAMEDDETYKNARASDRYGNWFVPLYRDPDDPAKDVTIKLPIPFEVGLLFKAVPEALRDYFRGTSTEQEWKAIRNLFLNQIPGGSSFMLPQLAKPLIEVGTNHSFFTGREIEGANMQGLAPQERYTARTTELAKRMSEMLQSDVTPDFLRLSPLQIEHLARGYLGSLPLMAAAMMNDVFGTPNAAAPTRKLTETPLIGTAFQDRYGNGAADILYAKIKAADQVQTTYNKMLNEGRKQDAKMYLADVENLRELPMLRQAESKLQLLAKQEKAIRSSDKLDADTKRERLDIIAARREQESRKYLDAVAAVAR